MEGGGIESSENQVLQPKSRKRSSHMLQIESTKKVKYDISKSKSLGWCSVCEINCITELVLTGHILGKKHKKMLKKLKKGDTSETVKKHNVSSKLKKFSKKECTICNVSLYSKGDFEAHITGRKHAKKNSDFSESLCKSKVKVNEFGYIHHKDSRSFDDGSLKVDKIVEDMLDLTDDGPDLKANSDKDARRENEEIKDNVDIPDGTDKKLELEVRKVKENTEIDHFDSEEDNKSDINVFAHTDFRESGVPDYAPLIKNNVDKTAKGGFDLIVIDSD